MCGENLDRAKRSGRVKYWISYYLPGRKERREAVGFSIEDAKGAEGKRRGQKKENRIFEMLPEAKTKVNELVDWYLNLEKTKNLAGYKSVKVYLDKFNRQFGSFIVGGSAWESNPPDSFWPSHRI